MINVYFKMLSQPQRGSILISHLLVTGLIGISVVALLSYMQGMYSQTQEIEQEQNISFNIHSNIISALRALLVSSTVNDSGVEEQQSKYGICSFLEQPNKSSGVELIQFNLGSSSGFPVSRWEAFFDKSEYKIMKTHSENRPCRAMDSNFAANKFSRCVKYIGKKEQTANEAYIIARVVPKRFPGFTAIDLSKANKLDAKTVLFELQSLTAVFEGDNYANASKQYKMIWANAVSECHITSTNNKKVIVQFSGSGPGRSSKHTIINNPDFGNVNTCNDLEFQDIAPHTKTAYSALGADGDQIGVDSGNPSSRAKTACRKKVFRCKGESSQSSDYEPVIFSLGISNDSGGILDLKKIGLTFVDEDSTAVSSGRSGKLTVEVYDRVQDFDANTALTDVQINPGHSVYKFTIKDKSAGDGSLKTFCDDACTSGNQRFPKVQIDLNKAAGATCRSYSSSYTDDGKNRFRCIVCHSKICTKYGVGAFGPIETQDGFQGLVDEPLDGTIPECKLPKNNNNNEYDLPSPTGTSGDCVAITGLDSANDFKFSSASYEFHNCSSQLPVLCFAYGHYIPAVTLSSPTADPTIFTGKFEEAQEACYKMGRELVKKTELGGFFKTFWGSVPGDTNANAAASLGLPGLSSNTNYFDYVNNAARGIFIAPSYGLGEISNILKNGYIKKFIDNTSLNKAWVAMRNDGGGQLIGVIPWAPVASSNVAIFRRKARPHGAILLKNTNTISPSDTDTVLTHNIQHKGVYNVDGSSGSRKALCRKVDSSGKFKEFKFSATTTLANAPTACITAGAKFFPPISSLEWVKAMTLIQKNDEVYPFPDPGDLSGHTSHIFSLSVNAPSLWVALSKKTGDNGAHTEKWILSDVYFPDNSGGVESIFKAGADMPDKGSGYIGIIDSQGRPYVPSGLNGQAVRNTNFLSSYKKACYSGTNPATLKPSVSATNFCSSGHTEVAETWLKHKRKSIKFMSEWVNRNTSPSGSKTFSNDKFLINQDAIDELKQRAKNVYCRKKDCPNCDSRCDNAYTSERATCRDNCPKSCTQTDSTAPDPNCAAACPPANAACLAACPRKTNAVRCSPCLNNCTSTAAANRTTCKNNCYTCRGTVHSNCNNKCNACETVKTGAGGAHEWTKQIWANDSAAQPW